jgi:hypothetical protein
MILPPFFGISSQYDVDFVKQIIVDYLQQDGMVYKNPVSSNNVTFIQIDGVTYGIVEPSIGLTYLNSDVLSLPKLDGGLLVTFNSVDILSYDPPPTVPEQTVFIFWLEEDSQIELEWNSPYNNRCNITEYILQYANTLEQSGFLDENYEKLLNELGDQLKLEPNIDSYIWYTFDKEYILIENKFKILNDINEYFMSEKSNGIGLVNLSVVTSLVNNNPYIFRVAAKNCAGTGPFGYSNILYPLPMSHIYCDIILYLRPNSTTDIFASLADYSCYNKICNPIANVTTSSQAKFGAGSIYFDGVLDNSLIPSTYPHIQLVKDNYNSWSLESDFTIELWAKPISSSPGSNRTIISSYSQKPDEYSNPINNHYWKLFYNNNGIVFRMGTSNTNFVELQTNIPLSSTSFTHIAVCRFNNYIRLYINGSRYDRKYYTTDIIIDSDYAILGGDQTNNYIASDIQNIERGLIAEPYIGYIDNVMLSKSARYAKDFESLEYTQESDCNLCSELDAPSNLTVSYVQGI